MAVKILILSKILPTYRVSLYRFFRKWLIQLLAEVRRKEKGERVRGKGTYVIDTAAYLKTSLLPMTLTKLKFQQYRRSPVPSFPPYLKNFRVMMPKCARRKDS